MKIIKCFKPEIVVTPHVLAEVSNLYKGMPGHKHDLYFRRFIERLRGYQEEHISLQSIIDFDLKVVVRLGIPDVAVVEAGRLQNAVIISADFGLVDFALRKGIPAIHFTSVRLGGALPN
ncbi:MAG: hypothetical protein PHV99_00400 [Candidatus Pacebacteria bacterium]|nr:hypothetical protein [Candidatus Paceibacterota bacterium]